MKAPRPAVDHSAAYMSRGATNNNAQNAPKGVSFQETLTHQEPDVGLGMNQHRTKMNKHGTRHKGPNEHMEPSHKLFDSLGKF